RFGGALVSVIEAQVHVVLALHRGNSRRATFSLGGRPRPWQQRGRPCSQSPVGEYAEGTGGRRFVVVITQGRRHQAPPPCRGGRRLAAPGRQLVARHFCTNAEASFRVRKAQHSSQPMASSSACSKAATSSALLNS